jgi:hypothetical protein
VVELLSRVEARGDAAAAVSRPDGAGEEESTEIAVPVAAPVEAAEGVAPAPAESGPDAPAETAPGPEATP